MVHARHPIGFHSGFLFFGILAPVALDLDDETDRRRAKQVEYNAEHGITPQSVQRAVLDIMEGAREAQEMRGRGTGTRTVAEPREDYAALAPAQAAARIRALEQKMYQHARDLEFEEAAKVRDQIRRLKDASLAG
jgi:excinuclease ABC subunit B